MIRRRVSITLAVAVPLLVGAGPGTLLSREPAPVPERFDAPLPARIDPERLSTTEELRSGGGFRLPAHLHIRQRLCRGDRAVRARFHDGLARALAEPGAPLRTAYSELALGCGDARDHCTWLASEAEETEGAAGGFLWWATATCWPLEDPSHFERAAAPDDAVVAFHARRLRTDRVHSERLADIVERRIAAGVEHPADNGLDAYARMDHPATARHLRDLYAAYGDAERRRLLVQAMRNQSDPETARLFGEECRLELKAQVAAWSAAGAPPRGSPTRFGDPCSGGIAQAWGYADERVREGGADDPLEAIPATLGRKVWMSETTVAQFGDHTKLLRELTELVRTDLDDAVFDDVWPAVDAVALHRGPHAKQLFLHGDAVRVGVPGRRGEPDPAAAEAIHRDLEVALGAPRAFDVWWRGERLRFEHRGTRDHYDVAAALAVVNFLLEEAGSARRVARLATSSGVAVLVAEPAGIARAREGGWLAPDPRSFRR